MAWNWSQNEAPEACLSVGRICVSLVTQREATESARGHIWALECDPKMSSSKRLDESEC